MEKLTFNSTLRELTDFSLFLDFGVMVSNSNVDESQNLCSFFLINVGWMTKLWHRDLSIHNSLYIYSISYILLDFFVLTFFLTLVQIHIFVVSFFY